MRPPFPLTALRYAYQCPRRGAYYASRPPSSGDRPRHAVGVVSEMVRAILIHQDDSRANLLAYRGQADRVRVRWSEWCLTWSEALKIAIRCAAAITGEMGVGTWTVAPPRTDMLETRRVRVGESLVLGDGACAPWRLVGIELGAQPRAGVDVYLLAATYVQDFHTIGLPPLLIHAPHGRLESVREIHDPRRARLTDAVAQTFFEIGRPSPEHCRGCPIQGTNACPETETKRREP